MTVLANFRTHRASVLALSMALAGCNAAEVNHSLYSVHQPVVERSVQTLDLASSGGALASTQKLRLDAWFSEMGLSYGDQVWAEGADPRLQAEIAAIAAPYGVMSVDALAGLTSNPDPATTRIVVQRSRAFVPGCPDWSAKSTAKLANGTSPGFGCAVNGNLAAMVADPEHLLHGSADPGETVVMTGSKAVAEYRKQLPTGGIVASDGDRRRVHVVGPSTQTVASPQGSGE